MPDEPDARAAAVVSALVVRGLTVGTGESLTAGLVSATLATVPGCSAVLMGGIVAYQRDVKARLLDVSDEALSAGLVSGPVARGMARGARRALGADIGIGTTGVAGPEPHDGQPVGTAWIAVSWGERDEVRKLSLAGDRAQIRCQTVEACLDLVLEVVAAEPSP